MADEASTEVGQLSHPMALRLATVKRLLFSAAILLMPFQDLNITGGLGGAFLRSAAVIPLGILTALLVADLARQKIPLWFALWLVGVLAATVYFLIEFDTSYLAESAVAKVFNNAMFILVFCVPAASYADRPGAFRVPVFIAFAIVAAAYVAGDVLRLPLFATEGPLHTLPNFQQRPRGVALESSIFGSQVVVIGTMAAYLAQTQFIRFVTALATVVLTFLVQSKGAVGAVLPAVLIAAAYLLRRSPFVTLGIVLLGLLALSVVTEDLMRWVELSADNGTSFSTRTALLIATGLFLVEHPLGGGLGTLAPVIQQSVGRVFDTLRGATFFEFDGTELYNNFLMTTSDRHLNTKSGILDFALLTGIPGIFVMVSFFTRPLKSEAVRSSFLLVLGLAFSLIALIAFVPFFGSYHFVLVAVIARSVWLNREAV